MHELVTIETGHIDARFEHEKTQYQRNLMSGHATAELVEALRNS